LTHRPALTTAGVDDLHFHDLPALRGVGAAGRTTERILLSIPACGHADERVTDGIYTHISEEQVAKAADIDPLENVAGGR
jgi:hypothetical protein